MPFTSPWTEDQKYDVCSHYVITGESSKKAGHRTGTPSQTIRGWKKQAWWPEMVLDIRKRHGDKFDGRFTAMIDRLYDSILDRIKDGDEVLWAKEGVMLKKQVSAKDMGILLNMIIEKRALLRGDPTSRTSNTSVDKQMENIQAKLEQRTKDMRKKVEDSENVEEIRKEG